MKIILTGEVPAGVALTLHDPELAADDADAWMEEVLGAPAGAQQASVTELGWPLTLAHAAVRDERGAVVEHRVGAFFRFFHFTAAAVARFTDLDAMTRAIPALVAFWQTGRPDFRGDGVIGLAQLWGDPAQLLN